MSTPGEHVFDFTLDSCSCCRVSERNFDDILKSCWVSRKHLLKYSPETVTARQLVGTYGFSAERNVTRKVSGRPLRSSQIFRTMSKDEFNFNKIAPTEIMMRLMSSSCRNNATTICSQAATYIIINLSPFASYSSLLVPSMSDNNCQFPTAWGLKQALLCSFASSDPKLKICFNSLCGHASVNHEHYHIFLSDLSYIQKAALKPVQHPVYEVEDYPAKGIVFLLNSPDQCKEVVSKVIRLANYLKDSDIAFNISLVKACSGNPMMPTGEICLFIWPRTPARGSKLDFNFIIASVELSGHLIITDSEVFENISEEFVIEQMKTINEQPWQHVKIRIPDLLHFNSSGMDN